MKHRVMATVVVGAMAVACGEAAATPAPEVSAARIGAPTGPNAALYLTATGGADVLVGATTPVADAVGLHETTMTSAGAMSMTELDSMDLDGSLVLEPGGLHIMLLDVQPLRMGDTVEVTLRWDTAGEQEIEATVVDPADTVEGLTR